jgi:2-polyprenyl-3-methyl-5-hydroxy-6-metoxy-1,4-benzoquinol methylase
MAQKVKECIGCGSAEFKPYTDSHNLIKCQNCGLVVADEIPTTKEIEKIYQQDYFFGMEYFDYKADRLALERNFRKRIKRLEFMLGKDFKVAEIGCAYGYFLNMIKDHSHSHIGFDVSREGVEHAQKELSVNATTTDFLNHEIEKGSLDSVFMWDVAEHLSFPDKYFKKVSEVLKPGGYVALTTGNIEAWLPRLRKSAWRMIHPPTHVYYFSPKTMEKLLDQYGLKVVSVKHPSTSRNVGSVFNQIISNRKALEKSTGHLEFVHKAATLVGAHKLNVPINTYDIMELVAVKQ